MPQVFTLFKRLLGVKVTLSNVDGGQSEVYKDAAYDNNDLNAGDYKITLGNGKTYTLTTGDLEFVASSDPTNVGQYQITLSKQGKDAISALDPTHYSYNVDTAGFGTFTITKAKPKVVLQGVGQKVYDGSAIDSYSTPISLVITAPGNPTITLGDGDYEFVKGTDTITTAPVDVGNYTIKLTAQGKNKILQDTDNDSNLDWANADISGEGSYKITKAEATATLSGSNNRDYNGNSVSTSDLDNGGDITVTIAIPNSTKTIGYTLKDGDYTWATAENIAPTDAGTYTISLNKDNILQHLQNKIAEDSTWKDNVDIAKADLSGTASFMINQKAADVSLSGTDNATYDGNQVDSPLGQLKEHLSATLVSGQTLDVSGLSASDFDWYNGSTKLSSAPTDHGTYTLKLNDTGMAELKNKNKNYSLSLDNNEYTFTIKKAEGSVVLNGSREITYGTADPNYYSHYSVGLTTDPATITGFTANYTLQAGDLEFSSNDGRSWTTDVPTAVGSYQVRLSSSGLSHIASANNHNQNIDWSADKVSGIKTYVIKAATATAELVGNASKTYNGQAVDLSDINNADSTIKVNITIPGTSDNHEYTLKAGDYVWNTTDNVAPTNAGDYTLSFDLTTIGKEHLKSFIDDIAGTGLNGASNVKIPTAVSGDAKFKVAPLTITVSQSGNGEKTYDSQVASVDLDTLKNNFSGSGLVNGQNLDLTTLTEADFDWYQGNTKLSGAPTDTGNYTIKLNSNGLTALQNANKNYSFSAVSGSYEYKINQANATIKLDSNDNAQTAIWNGNDISLDLSKFKPTITTDNNNQLTISLPSSLNLTVGDYSIIQNNSSVTPKEPGTYEVQLTEQGWQKVRDAITGHGNYKWTSTGNGTLTVKKATATITLGGSADVTYTGETALIPYEGKYTITLSNGESYTLQNGDLEFSAGENPIDVGNYTVQLSTAGLSHIKEVDSDHYTYTYDNGTAALKVIPATATATITGSDSKTYNGQVASLDDGTYSVTLSNGSTYVLRSGDYNFVDNDGNVIASPTNVGSYKVGLTTQGKTAIEALTKVGTKNNYSWKFEDKGSYEINAQKMEIIVEGEASKVYDGQDAKLTASDLTNGNVSLRWGNSSKPSDITLNLTPDDFEVVDSNGQAVKNSNVIQGTENTNKTYYIKLKDSVLNTIKNQDKNYDFSLGITNAFYKIYARKAALTVNGSQTVNYGSPEKLDLNKYQVVLSNWTGETPAPPINLQDGDLQVELNNQPQYDGANAGLPINVGNYTVTITDALRTRLENDPRFSDYDFGDNSTGSMPLRGGSHTIDRTHEPAVYIVQPLQIQVKIKGSQSIEYDSNNYNDPAIINDNGQYRLEFDNIANRDNVVFNSYQLQSGDLTFVSTPGDVGSYQVKLTDAGIAHLKSINGIDKHNYDWNVNVANARANFDVVQMPVTITVSNKEGSNGQKVVFGQSIENNPDDYQVTITTDDGTTLTGWSPSVADLQFDGATPSNVSDHYKVILSADGLQSIENKFGTKNYSYSSKGNGTFAVAPAKATITLSGSENKIYDGEEASPSAGHYTLTLPNGFTYTLSNNDLEVVNNSSNVGDYQVQLKQSVLDAIEGQDGNEGKNYDWTVTQTNAKYDITKATATVDFENAHNSEIVNYKDQSQFESNNFVPTISTDNGKTLMLPAGVTLSVADGDFEFLKFGETSVLTSEPFAVGTYTVKLSDKGLAKIKKNNTSNYNWKNLAIGTYTINPISITISGKASESTTYDGTSFGDQNGLDLNKFKPILDANGVTVPVIPLSGDDALTSDDYTIKQNGVEVMVPTNVGSYDIYLNENGLKKLKKLSDDFTWTTADEIKLGKFTINPTSASAKLAGSNEKTYNGQTVSVADLNKDGGDIHVTITVKLGNTDKTFDYQLQAGDYTWDTSTIPVNASETPYVLSLNKDAILTHLKDKIDQTDSDLKNNYSLEIANLAGQANFRINQKKLDITDNISSDSAEKIYDGTKGSVTVDQLINGWKVKGLVNRESLNTNNLTLNDFDWNADHVNVGTYYISLKPSGLAKLKADNPNYSLESIPNFKYTIKAAQAIATLSGHGEKTYDGQPVSDAEVQKQDANNNITVTIMYPGLTTSETVKLTADEFDWTSDSTSPFMILVRDASTGVPKDAGRYILSLNGKGIEAIKAEFADNHNIKWDATSFKGIASYLIEKANGSIDLNGSDSKVFDNQETTSLDGSKFSITVNGIKQELQAGEYKIVDAQGNIVRPKNVGTYYVELTDAGLKALENSNYNWTINNNGTQVPNQVGTYEITAATAKPELSGKNSKVYDGKIVTVDQVNQDGRIRVTISIPNIGNVTYTLKDGDYDWANDSGTSINVPKEIGKYFIKLTVNSLANLQKVMDDKFGKGNVKIEQTLEGTGQAEFDIVAAGHVNDDNQGDPDHGNGNGNGNIPTPPDNPNEPNLNPDQPGQPDKDQTDNPSKTEPNKNKPNKSNNSKKGDKNKDHKKIKEIKRKTIAKKSSWKDNRSPEYENMYHKHVDTASLHDEGLKHLEKTMGIKGEEQSKTVKTLPQTGENNHQNEFLVAFGVAMSSLAGLFSLADKKKKKDK